MATPQEILDNVKSLNKTDTDQLLLEKSRGTITATLVGAGVGLVVAHFRGMNKFFGAVIGGSIAGIGSNILMDMKKRKKDGNR